MKISKDGDTRLPGACCRAAPPAQGRHFPSSSSRLSPPVLIPGTSRKSLAPSPPPVGGLWAVSGSRLRLLSSRTNQPGSQPLSPCAPAPDHLSALPWAHSSLSASLMALTPTLHPTSTPEPDSCPQPGTALSALHLFTLCPSLSFLSNAPLALPARTSSSAPPIFPSPRSSRL